MTMANTQWSPIRWIYRILLDRNSKGFLPREKKKFFDQPIWLPYVLLLENLSSIVLPCHICNGQWGG